jgi:hypothetical protein
VVPLLVAFTTRGSIRGWVASVHIAFVSETAAHSPLGPSFPETSADWPHFSTLRKLLEKHFSVEYKQARALTPEFLVGVDLLVINMTASETPLAANEQVT